MSTGYDFSFIMYIYTYNINSNVRSIAVNEVD
jgi:hypothetical protein